MDNKEMLVLLQCYNRGCGQKFNANENPDDGCQHHPGLPFFHDAYKGWTCCNKKCTDFTEFLNIKGCKISSHSNVKPLDPEKPIVQNEIEKEVVEIKPMERPQIQRPPINTPMITMKPELAPSLKQQSELNKSSKIIIKSGGDIGDISAGTSCKNKGCNAVYEGPQSNDSYCIYHSGSPIFHEGMKYWSCCQKKTTDFNAFLNQVGCQSGKHKWIQENSDSQIVNCRWDWHQTASHVVISIYAKEYCPNKSIVQLNPVRLFVNLVFPLLDNTTFTLDIELQKVIDVKASQAFMYGTKVEIKLKKAEPGSWSKIEIAQNSVVKPTDSGSTAKIDNLQKYIKEVDLSDL